MSSKDCINEVISSEEKVSETAACTMYCYEMPESRGSGGVDCAVVRGGGGGGYPRQEVQHMM